MALNYERPFPLPKETLDTLNSLSWFFMDAFWMMGFVNAAYTCVLPTIISGALLLYIEKRRSVFLINLAINCWIWMNTVWMISDLHDSNDAMLAARILFSLGVVCIALAAVYSQGLTETFSHFRRFRGLKLKL